MTAILLSGPEPQPSILENRRKKWRTLEAWAYVCAAAGALLAVTIMTRLWRAVWSVPFYYGGDATSSASYFKTTLDTGWYETQMDLGVPYGQHYHDYPFSDDLHPMMIKVFGLFTSSWPIVFNTYYIAGFPFAALTALWFFRRCNLSTWLSVALAVLFAVAPYHLWRNQGHYFLGEYWAVPLGLGVVLAVLRGEPIWGRRRLPQRLRGLPRGLHSTVETVTGRGTGTVVAIALVTLDGAYYGVFTALLLAPAGVLALVRTRNWRRFLGAAAAGITLLTVFTSAMLPDIVYEHVHGSDAAAFFRRQQEAEIYALKFSSLILPAPGYPIPWLARLRSLYDSHYPLASEGPALGLMGAVGFLLLLGLLLVVIIRGPLRTTDPIQQRRWQTLCYLSALTWIAFLAGTVGGIGTLISFITPGIRGWNRISIFINLFALAGLGLAIEGGLQLLNRRRSRVRSGAVGRSRIAVPVIAVIVTIIGVADQSSTRGIPTYNSPRYMSDDAFVKALQMRLPVGSWVFEAPYQAFPESPNLVDASDSDQIKLFLHSTTLRWSGGGFKGRPQTLWPRTIAAESAGQMTRDLAIVGFAGIVIDRFALADRGKALQSALARYTGGPILSSTDGRWTYLSLSAATAVMLKTLTASKRAALAASIVHANG